MSVYVYRRKVSDGANLLAEAIDATRYRALKMPMATKVRTGDVVICWGETMPERRNGVRVLNGGPFRNKFEDAEILRRAGVRTIETSRTRPQATAPVPQTDPAVALVNRLKELCGEFAEVEVATPIPRTGPFVNGVTDLFTSVQQVASALRTAPPAPRPGQVTGEWLPRKFNHVGGDDLMQGERLRDPDFWVKKEAFVEEFRIHSFLGKSIRAGKKVPREDFNGTRSNWIRSWDAGWRIAYDGVSSKKAHRMLAHQAVAALGLDFGAVDIGQKADGTLVVLEVNRAPGIKQGTVDKYVDAIKKWQAGEWVAEAASDPDRGER